MKHTLAGLLTLALALPLLADEAKKKEEPKPAIAPAAQPDSPLVAAAKRANRLGKKPSSKVVITNETLKAAGGNAHVTTTQSQGSLEAVVKMPPPAPTPEMVRAKQLEDLRAKEAEAAAAKQKAEEQRAKRMRYAAQNAEEEYPDDVDPAQAEQNLSEVHAQKPPR